MNSSYLSNEYCLKTTKALNRSSLYKFHKKFSLLCAASENANLEVQWLVKTMVMTNLKSDLLNSFKPTKSLVLQL